MTCAMWSARLALVVLGCSVAATLAPAPAGADTRLVDCASGRRLATALKLPAGRQLTVIVRGTCNESVTITRDDVTLRGESPAAGSGVNGTIVIDGARRVLVENLTISGPGIGIQGIHGAAFTVRGSVIQDTAGTGVVLQGARATIDANTVQRTGGAGVNLDNAEAIITGNTIELNAGTGVFAIRSVVILQGGNVIQSNAGNGIAVAQGQLAGRPGTLRDTVTGNGSNGGRGLVVEIGGSASLMSTDVTSNLGDGVGVFGGTLSLAGSTVSGNSGNGIQAFNGARIDVLDSTVTGNGRDGIGLNLNSSLYVRNSGASATTTVSNNAGNGIGVFVNSVLNMSTENGTAPVSVTGNAFGWEIVGERLYGVLCSASQVYGDVSRVTGNVWDSTPSPLSLGTCPFSEPAPPPAD